jgi:hypothetical protein
MRARTGVRELQQNRYGDPVALGRSKLGRRQPQRDDDSFADQQQAQPDSELENYLQALAPEDGPGAAETTNAGKPFGSSEVYQLRLPLMANERLKELAAKQGTSPGALARDWVMQHLSDGQGDPSGQPVPDGFGAGGPSGPMGAEQPPQQFGQPRGPQQFGGPDQFGQPMPPADQQVYDPYANAYGADPYGQDPYNQDPYNQDPYAAADPYAADPYAGAQFAGGPYGGPQQDPGTDQQFPADQFPGGPQNNPYAGGMPPGAMAGGPAAGGPAAGGPGGPEQPPGLGTQVLNGPPGPDAANQPPAAAGTQMLTPAGVPGGASPDASTQLIGADPYGPMPADQPQEQFPSNDFPANQLPGQPPAGGPAWPQEAPQAPQGSQPPPRARNPYVAGGPPPAPGQAQQPGQQPAQQGYGAPPFPTVDAEMTVPGNGQYY